MTTVRKWGIFLLSVSILAALAFPRFAKSAQARVQSAEAPRELIKTKPALIPMTPLTKRPAVERNPGSPGVKRHHKGTRMVWVKNAGKNLWQMRKVD